MPASNHESRDVSRSETINLSINGMSCASCVGRVEAALARVAGVTGVAVNLATERATVHGTANPDALLAAVDKAGYDARVLPASGGLADGQTEARKDAERIELQHDGWLALLLALPVFVLEMGSHLSPGMHEWVMQTMGSQTSWTVQFALTTLVLLFPGRRFYLKGLPALWRFAPDMNSLVALGTLAAYAYSVVATFTPAWLPPGSAAFSILIFLPRCARVKSLLGSGKIYWLLSQRRSIICQP